MTQRQHSPEAILITGASGLIGSRLCQRLHADYDLIGFDLPEQGPPPTDHDHIDVDLTKSDSVREAVARLKDRHGEQLASVIHLAAYYDFSGKPSPLYDQLTVEGTQRLLRELRSQELAVEQFVFSSSLLVMRPDEAGGEISEGSPTDPKWAYPKSKLEAEAVIRAERGGIPCVILRIAGVYDEECHSLPISQQIARIYERRLESYVFPGDASHGQALVHLDDLVDCFRLTIENRRRLADEEVFLIAEPEVMSYGDLQDRLGELIHGREWPTIRIPKFVAKAGAYVQQRFADDDEQPFIQPWMIDLADDHYDARITHARETLGWTPRRQLQETLPEMIDFLHRDPRGFYRTNKLPLPEELMAASAAAH